MMNRTQQLEFSVLKDPQATRAYCVEYKDPPSTEDLLDTLRGSLPASPPQFVRYSGVDLRDVIWTSFPFVFLFNDRVIAAMQAANLTGWEPYAVHLQDRDDACYSGLRVHGRCGPKEDGGEAWFDPATWDGSDVFMRSDHSAWVIFSENAARALRAIGLTNAKLVPMSSI